MYRCVVILTILTLLACPLKCASGGCSSAPEMQGLRPVEASKSCKCCHHKKGPVEESPQKRSLPCDDCTCQGICAGAVIEKHQSVLDCPFAIAAFVVTPDLIAAERPSISGFSEFAFPPVAAKQSGRGLRLHVHSLTC